MNKLMKRGEKVCLKGISNSENFRDSKGRHHCTKKEIEILKKNYLNLGNKELSKIIGCSINHIRTILKHVGLKRGKDSLSKIYFNERKGEKHPLYGKHHTEETIEKMRIYGKTHPVNFWLGKKRDEKTKEKIRNTKINNPIKYWLGRKLKEEHRKNLSESHKGKKNWIKGKKHKKESKEKMSLAKKGKYCLENHPNWKGGLSFEPYGEEFNINLKNEIRKRDNQMCMNCGVHR